MSVFDANDLEAENALARLAGAGARRAVHVCGHR